MTNPIRLKRRWSGAAGSPAALASGEVAYNGMDDTLYIGFGDDGSGNATSIKTLAGIGAFLALTGDQTIGGVKTFSFSPLLPTPTTADNSTAGATTAFVKAQGYMTNNKTITLSGDASGSGTTAITVTFANSGVAAGSYGKVTVNAKGIVTAGAALAVGDIPTLTASKISDFQSVVNATPLSSFAVPTAPVSMNSFRITGVGTPASGTDAANKDYVDSLAQGLDAKDSVKAATTANITLSGTQTIDGVALVAGDRVLVKDQTTASANGIYVVAASAWARSADTNLWTELPGAFTFVEQGTTNAASGWVCTVAQGGTIGTTSVTFAQFSGAGQINAGTGMTATGNTLNVIGTTNRITANADSIDIASTYVGQTSITTLGTIGTGTWNATAIGVTKGGTGLTAAVTGLLKGNGTTYAAAVAGTDYLDPNSVVDGGTF